ncbi:universal stress protein [Pseudoroseicyclus tamaricis]|uniref:Universal stress protein n=1 Tax=Pseudoroseicyclus tamaricis TaxID=2705421 RepID=A0A6B2JWY1_9RHOB|nr:universal stress protein [Pseudoroseicyclus tamaricis]NDV00734.1 universal stress protein [Pseudoroseicyclus tamaricis]
MFTHIMVPVDLAHTGALERALAVSADLAKQHGATVTYVAVHAATPGAVAHTPEEFSEKLAAFAAGQGSAHGVTAQSHDVVSHDPSVDLDDKLMAAADEIGADLIVMASHVPGLADHLWPSNGGKIARHFKRSVFVVRGE